MDESIQNHDGTDWNWWESVQILSSRETSNYIDF